MNIRECVNREEWDEYVLEHDGHPLQLWGWGDVKSAHGWSAYRLMGETDDKIIGTAQVLIRKLPQPFRSLAYIPRGPVTDANSRTEFLNKLADYIKKNFRSVSLKIEPDETDFEIGDGWLKSSGHILPSQTIILDLTKTSNMLLADMSKKTRQYIRKSSKEESIKIKRVRNQAELEACLELYHATAERAKFNLHSDSYYYDAFHKMGDHAQVFAAYEDNQPVAFLWLAISANTAFELYGGMNETGQRLRANYALKWHAISKCQEWGIKRYDFGGLIDGGVSTFKMGWAIGETELAGTFDKPLSASYSLWTKTLPVAKKSVRAIKGLFKL